ncbi:MAG: hypothetical protein H7Y10_03545 [Flavobacterium sp.]|nr:hypothetical protein [Flavobacterium sp.]
MIVELNVLWQTDEQHELQKAGVDINFEECTIRVHTFYQIAFILPGDEEGICQVASNGETFFVKESYESVKKKIDDQIIFKWN